MTDIIANTQAQLAAALKAAKGGETIKLVGTFASLTLSAVAYAMPVTITSLDAAQRATIERVQLNRSSNVVLQGLDLGRQIKPTEPDFTQLHNVTGCRDIAFEGVTISAGSGDPAASLGWGLFLRDSQNVTVSGSSFDHCSLALLVQGVDGLTIAGNTFHKNRRDGINLAEVTDVVIDGNFFTEMYPVGAEHPDAIQFLTKGKTKLSSNIAIRNNVVLQGAGEAIQGIFMNDEEGTLPYTNVEISNNLIYVNGMYNGISIQGGQNVYIEGNTVLSRTDDAIRAWIRLEKVNGARVSGNVSDNLVAGVGNSNLTIEGNSWLTTDSATLRQLGNINAIGAATIEDLVVEGIGYQPPALKRESARDLLLGLQFTPAGLVDASRFNSVATAKPIDTSRIGGGMFAVKAGAGTGFELNRSNSVQLFALPAMVLSFDMKRDSATAPVGQIIGVHMAWAISLTAKGELTATIKNDAGKSFSFTTSGAELNDTATHRIDFVFDGRAGNASLQVDGVVKGSAPVAGSTRAIESWGLYIGAPFAAAFSGAIGNIEIREG